MPVSAATHGVKADVLVVLAGVLEDEAAGLAEAADGPVAEHGRHGGTGAAADCWRGRLSAADCGGRRAALDNSPTLSGPRVRPGPSPGDSSEKTR